MNLGILIPLVAIVGGLAIPVVALFFDFQRRKLRFEERRAMIERGMQPPPESQDETFGGGSTDPVVRRERLLNGGLVSFFTGIGLGLGAWVLIRIPYTFSPRGVAGPLAVAACIVALAGVGLMLAWVFSRPRG
jgi:VIT1/CCC1 family predicted Fe2+/Mn2+ transporter